MRVNNDTILELRDLCNKYATMGLDIDIEFRKYGVVLRGYWEGSAGKYNYNRVFDYVLFENASSLSLEYLIDMFVEDFDEQLAGEVEENDNT